jgi:hypothetical protein
MSGEERALGNGHSRSTVGSASQSAKVTHSKVTYYLLRGTRGTLTTFISLSPIP